MSAFFPIERESLRLFPASQKTFFVNFFDIFPFLNGVEHVHEISNTVRSTTDMDIVALHHLKVWKQSFNFIYNTLYSRILRPYT